MHLWQQKNASVIMCDTMESPNVCSWVGPYFIILLGCATSHFTFQRSRSARSLRVFVNSYLQIEQLYCLEFREVTDARVDQCWILWHSMWDKQRSRLVESPCQQKITFLKNNWSSGATYYKRTNELQVSKAKNLDCGGGCVRRSRQMSKRNAS